MESVLSKIAAVEIQELIDGYLSLQFVGRSLSAKDRRHSDSSWSCSGLTLGLVASGCPRKELGMENVHGVGVEIRVLLNCVVFS